MIAYGHAPAEEKNAVKAANMAEENAILKAQMKIYEEFQVPKENPTLKMIFPLPSILTEFPNWQPSILHVKTQSTTLSE